MKNHRNLTICPRCKKALAFVLPSSFKHYHPDIGFYYGVDICECIMQHSIRTARLCKQEGVNSNHANHEYRLRIRKSNKH